MTILVTVVKPTDTVVILEERPLYWKRIALYWQGDNQPYARGWIVGDSVEQAVCVFGSE